MSKEIKKHMTSKPVTEMKFKLWIPKISSMIHNSLPCYFQNVSNILIPNKNKLHVIFSSLIQIIISNLDDYNTTLDFHKYSK